MTNKEISTAQLEANRLNAQKSTGPRTDAGKANARFNARRHGLTGQFYCMSVEDETAYKTFEANMFESLKPLGAYEHQLAVSITQDHWRMNRSRSVEFNLYGQGHDRLAEDTDAPTADMQAASTMADTYRGENRVFANIALYETRIHRMIAKNRHELKELQAERKAAETKAREDAELLVQLAAYIGEDMDSAPPIEINGFVFSVAEINRKLNRDERLNVAREYAKRGWKTDDPYLQRRLKRLKAA